MLVSFYTIAGDNCKERKPFDTDANWDGYGYGYGDGDGYVYGGGD